MFIAAKMDSTVAASVFIAAKMDSAVAAFAPMYICDHLRENPADDIRALFAQYAFLLAQVEILAVAVFYGS